MKWKAILWVAIAAIGLTGTLFALSVWNTLRKPIPKLEHARLEITYLDNSFYLSNVPTLDEVHHLDGEFKIVRRMDQIPDACMLPFYSFFVTVDGSHAKAGDILLANPGERFNRSDVIDEDLPFRRLEFAGLNATGCFVYYRRGGMFPSHCLAVVDTIAHKAGVGTYDRAAKNVKELRRMLIQGRFRDGDAC